MMIGPGFFFVSVASRASATGMGLSNCSYMQVIGGLRAGLPLKAVIISLKFCGGFESLSHRIESLSHRIESLSDRIECLSYCSYMQVIG